MAGSLADLLVRVLADTSNFVRGIDQADNQVTKMGNNLVSRGKAMTMTGAKLTAGVTLPIAGIGFQAIKAASEYEKSLNTMAAVAQVPEAQLKELDALAIKLGQDTIFSTQEAASAMLELSKGGLSAATIQAGALKTNLDLAAASDMDLAEAGQVLANAMNTFSLSGEEATRVADALAGAANASSADIPDLAYALRAGGAAAARFNIPVEETTALLALLADRGIAGSDAGTLLKSQLRTLVPVTEKARDKMKDLGLDFFDAKGQFIGIAGMAEELKRELGNLSQEQRELAINQLFGSDASRLAGILIKEGSGILKEYTDATSKAGAAQDVAAAKMKGLPGALEQLSGSIETAVLSLGRVLAPFIKDAANFITDLVNKFTELPGPVKKGVVIVGALLAVLGPLLAILGFLVTGIGGLAGVVGAVSAPVLAIIAVIGVLIAVFVKLWNENEKFRAAVMAAWGKIVAFAKKIWPDVKEVISLTMKLVQAIIKRVVGWAVAFWNKFGNNIMKVVKIAWNFVKEFITAALKIIKGIIKTVTSLIKGDWSGVWEGIKTILAGVWDAIIAILRGALALAYEAVKIGIEAILTFFKNLPGWIWDALKGLAGLLFDIGKDLITGLLNGIKEGAKKVFEFVGSIGAKIKDLKGPIEKDRKLLTPQGNAIMEGFNKGLVAGSKDVFATMSDITNRLQMGGPQGPGGFRMKGLRAAPSAAGRSGPNDSIFRGNRGRLTLDLENAEAVIEFFEELSDRTSEERDGMKRMRKRRRRKRGAAN